MAKKKSVARKPSETLRPVVVTTEFRGVFFGYTSAKKCDALVRLERARMCVYWDSSLHGVLGLASAGPGSKCKIGNCVSSIELRGVTAVIECSAEAVAKWEVSPWS